MRGNITQGSCPRALHIHRESPRPFPQRGLATTGNVTHHKPVSSIDLCDFIFGTNVHVSITTSMEVKSHVSFLLISYFQAEVDRLVIELKGEGKKPEDQKNKKKNLLP